MNRRVIPSRQHQRGAVAVIIAIMFLVIVGYATVVMLDMGAGEMHDANLGEADTQAQLLAEAGLERAFYRFKTGTVCANVAKDPNNANNPDPAFALGAGQFTVTAAVLEGSDCRITAEGQVGNVKAVLQGLAKPAWRFTESIDYTGGGSGAGQFLATWTVVLTSAQGNTGWDNGNNCPTSVCPGSAGESYRMRTNTGTGNQLLQGYAHRALPAPVVTTAGMQVTYAIGYRKQYSATPQAQELSVRLYNSSTGQSDTIWSDTSLLNSNSWFLVTNSTSVTSGRTYDRIAVDFKLDEFPGRGNRQIRMWIDEIRLSW